MANLSNNAESLVAQWLMTAGAVTRPTAWWLGLGTASSDTGLTGEPSGNGYARQSVTFTVTGDQAANSTTPTFGPSTGAGWGTLTHVGVFDASTGGNLIAHGPLTASITNNVGNTHTVAASAVTLTMS